jgi:hypothetical protein
MRVVLMLVLAFAVIGCNSDEKNVPVPLDQVPENVMKVAKEKLPDVKFEKAQKKPNGEFEVIGKDKTGKVREIDIKPDGTVTEIE